MVELLCKIILNKIQNRSNTKVEKMSISSDQKEGHRTITVKSFDRDDDKKKIPSDTELYGQGGYGPGMIDAENDKHKPISRKFGAFATHS